MKKIVIILLMIGIVYPLSAISFGDYENAIQDTVKNTEEGDTTRIRIGKKQVDIVENEEGTSVDIKDVDGDEDSDEKIITHSKSKKRKFEGHWDGFGIGIANFMDADYSMSRTPETNFLDLNTGRSNNININLFQQGVGLGTNHIGLVTGLGFEFNDYFFDNNNSIVKNSEGVVEELGYDINLTKSKLMTTYLVLPVLLEINLGRASNPHDRFYINGGVIGGVKLGSKTKVVYKENGNKEKKKNKDDFNINSLRYGLTARAGYKDFQVYANYYITPFFEDNKGPELNAFAVGIAVSFD